MKTAGSYEKDVFEHGKEIGTSENLLNYIWKEVIGKQLGLNTAQVKPCERMQKTVSVLFYGLTVDADNANTVPS
jgi:hypothetical protein